MIPEGWKLVPVEPTPEMLAATSWPKCAETDYRHMLAAAPTPPVQQVGCEDDDGLLHIHPETETCEVCKPVQQDGEALAWVPKWAVDRLTGKIGAVADPVMWGENAPLYNRATEGCVPVYLRDPSPRQQDDEAHSAAVSHLWKCLGRWSAGISQGGSLAEIAPTPELVDAVSAATLPRKDDEALEVLRQAIHALDEAADSIADWGSYAGDFFAGKHDLDGDIKRTRDAAAHIRALITKRGAT